MIQPIPAEDEFQLETSQDPTDRLHAGPARPKGYSIANEFQHTVLAAKVVNQQPEGLKLAPCQVKTGSSMNRFSSPCCRAAVWATSPSTFKAARKAPRAVMPTAEALPAHLAVMPIAGLGASSLEPGRQRVTAAPPPASPSQVGSVQASICNRELPVPGSESACQHPSRDRRRQPEAMPCAGTSRGITSGLDGLHLGHEQVRLRFPGAEQTACLCCRQQQYHRCGPGQRILARVSTPTPTLGQKCVTSAWEHRCE